MEMKDTKYVKSQGMEIWFSQREIVISPNAENE